MRSLQKDTSKTRPGMLLGRFLLAFLLMIGFLLGGCATSKHSISKEDNEKIRIITTVFAAYDFTREIAGSHAEVSLLIPPGAELHAFEPTPQDILEIQGCDLFIYVGGESDAWIADILSAVDTAQVRVLRLMDLVELLNEDESVLVDPLSGSEEELESDEHVWTTPRNAKLITRAISENLILLDPDNASQYEANTQAYLSVLDELDREFRDIVLNAQRSTLVFADRFPFAYFAQEYGLQCYAAFPGCSQATEPSALTVVALIDLVRAEGIPVVFYRELSNRSLADVVAQEAGAQALLLHSCHNISRQDFEQGASYVSLMRANAENLKVALN
ncbi:MAG: metal ABC transporter substrate-binding protein [Coriobacteriia bacterium]|nr:metal ABC transporter substrate-binding protein [Coriobacteriia bacterium]